MIRRRPRWLVATLVVTVVGLLPTGCGADPVLQRQQSDVMRRTCVSLRERDGIDPVRTPPKDFMSDFIAKVPHGDTGPLTRDELEARCDAGAHDFTAAIAPKRRIGS